MGKKGKKSERQTQREAGWKEDETDRMVPKSWGFEMHSTYFKTTGIKS